MTTQTFQGKLRTTSGRPKSTIHRDLSLPVAMLTATPVVMMQLHIPAGTPVGTEFIGMHPAGFVIDEVITITGTDTNITVSLPAYGGLNAVADLSVAAQYTTFDIDRPVEVAVAVTAQADDVIIGVRGWALDNSADGLN